MAISGICGTMILESIEALKLAGGPGCMPDLRDFQRAGSDKMPRPQPQTRTQTERAFKCLELQVWG